MKKNLHFLIFFLGLSIVLGIASPSVAEEASGVAVPPPIADQGYSLKENWDFGSNIVNEEQLRDAFYTRYASNHGTTDHLNDEWQVYRDDHNHILSDGVLHLVARAPSGQMAPGKIESGMIRSKWKGKYGYYEARMKLPPGRGMWPAFWFANEWWPPEIDVVEVVNNGQVGTNKSYHNLHGKFEGHVLSSILDKGNAYVPGFDFSSDYHTFAIEWTPTKVKHYVDNVLVVEREFKWKHDNGVDAEDAPVIVNLAVGGNWAGPPTGAAEFPQSLDVAFIRVWQK
jgi:beta-glucanase (GH16 family)